MRRDAGFTGWETCASAKDAGFTGWETCASAKDAGFTLVEVLVSLFIFALISAGTLAVMFQTFNAREALQNRTEVLADVTGFRAVLRADFDAMTLRSARDGLGSIDPVLATTDGDALFTFTRLGRANPTLAPRGQAERVRYILRDGQFLRESLPHENPAQLDLWRARVLLENVKSAEFQLWDTSGREPVAFSDWRMLTTDIASGAELPAAIELILTTDDGIKTPHLFELGP